MTANEWPSTHQRLAAKVRERRLVLGMSITGAADSAGMSKDTWRRIEEGGLVRQTTYTKIDSVLGWAPGSALGILDGSDPIEVEQLGGGVTAARIPEGELDKAITGAMVAVVDTMTAAEIREVARRVVEELKDKGVL
ncbi:helix-turn-helix domain-containing protein [Streptomyces sp. NBC_00101]|uniref:helix-turn-helix domain-containing protein n=1 Tax=Streptomyces sp. NBC_00101 TaxID=2975651 RepID=UPI0032489F90